MVSTGGMAGGVATAIDDLLDNVARVEKGQEILLLAHLDGLFGSDNLVDQLAIDWIQSGIQQRGANASVLWIDEPDKPHEWRIPPVLKAAMAGCDTFINHSFNLVTEDIRPLRNYFMELGIKYVRNFATTSSLLNTAWAQTPSKLVAEIRYQASKMIEVGKPMTLTDNKGTALSATIAAPSHMWFPTYACYREEGGGYLPWPEWVFPPINLEQVNGTVVFDCMLSWWSRYIGIPPYFLTPIHLEIEDSRIKSIEGGDEAAALKSFLELMKGKIGDCVYDFKAMHSGVHPQAMIGNHQCPNTNYRRIIEHAHTSNIHVHIGSEHKVKEYPYWLHVTGDIRDATWKVGDQLIHDNGYLTALKHPEVLAVAEKYPNRPGLKSVPWQY
jgi:hypothetical protein